MNQPDPAEIETLPNPPITRLPDSVRAVFRAAPSSAVVDTLFNHADALLAALATAEERRDQAEFQAEKYGREARTLRNQCVSLDERRERAEAVVGLAGQLGDANACGILHMESGIWKDLSQALANYHKATGPQAEVKEES